MVDYIILDVTFKILLYMWGVYISYVGFDLYNILYIIILCITDITLIGLSDIVINCNDVTIMYLLCWTLCNEHYYVTNAM